MHVPSDNGNVELMYRAVLVATVLMSIVVAQTPDYLSWAQPGPYIASAFNAGSVDSFRSDQRIVGTYFFYWFDAPTLQASGEHFVYTPVDDQTQSFLDPAW